MGKGKTSAIIIAVIVVLIISGFLYEYFQLSNFVNNLAVSEIRVLSIDFKGVPPTKVHLDLNVKLYNPTSYDAFIDKLTYSIYINDIHVGDGSKENIVIYPRSETVVSLPIDVTTIDTVKALLNSLQSGYANIKVRAYIVMPVRWFGVVRVFTVEHSIESSKTIPIKLPWSSVASTVRVINAWFEPMVVSVGTPVKVNVELYSETVGKFDIKILIRQDKAFAVDVTVYEFREVLEFEGIKNAIFYLDAGSAKYR